MTFLIVLIITAIALLVSEIIIRILKVHFSSLDTVFDEKTNLHKFKPFQKGRYKLTGKDFEGHYRINNEGWNSTHDYLKKREPNTNRIACIGSSDTIALQIDVEDAYPQVIENTLNNLRVKNEVYTFGISVISIAQVLHLVRHIVNDFNPDIITITSYSLGGLIISSPSKSNFLTLSVASKENIKEIPPKNINKLSLIRRLYRLSALLKYLNRTYRIYQKIESLLNKLHTFFHLNSTNITVTRQNNNDLLMKYPSYRRKYDIAVRYIYEQLRKTSMIHNIKLLFVFYPQSFYSHRNDDFLEKTNESEGRIQTKSLLNDYSLPYFDLTETFVKDYQTNKIKLDFADDGHFNEHGHRVMGEAIAKFLIENKYLQTIPVTTA